MFRPLRRWLQAPDDLMLEAGAVGEVLVARIRLVVVLLIVPMPLIALATGARMVEVRTGALVALAALIFSIVLLRKARRQGAEVRWRFVSAAFDITSISTVLGLFLLQGFPHISINSRVVWELYLISIAATALRGDARVCLFAGALALVQYGAILAVATTRFGDLSDPKWAPFLYGYLSWGDQISRLILIAAATLIALACVHQVRKLLVLSSRDRLTGVRNRAWLDSRLARELSEAALHRRPVSLAMVDVDGFKPFNDRYGHLSGDAALRAIGQRLADRFGDVGYVARYGGEEFTVVLPGQPRDAAYAHCDRVRALFVADRIDLPGNGGDVESPTLSFGLAEWRPGESDEALIDRADRALIEAKQAGRNRVVRAPSNDRSFRTSR
jgi:diguanylate cyclase (GGDEF)-like protein